MFFCSMDIPDLKSEGSYARIMFKAFSGNGVYKIQIW